MGIICNNSFLKIIYYFYEVIPITNIKQLDLNGSYTYADYLTWQFKERLELFNGKIFKISPAPNWAHQRVSGNLFGTFWTIFKDHSCNLFSAPFDVRLVKSQKKIHKF